MGGFLFAAASIVALLLTILHILSLDNINESIKELTKEIKAIGEEE